MSTRVYITGVGVVSSLGLGKEEFYRSVATGQSGISPVSSFDATNLGRLYAGEVKQFRARDHLTAVESRRMGRCSAMALAAARMAVGDAGIDASHLKGPRAAVVLGTTMGEADILEDLEGAWIQKG
ncbi:MAG: beta-ketoacyl-[acyl-carrier-protein] synthase II, partial [Polyangiaceae bacterium]|nr:beta-ketoacyl-[acyl-carrier-protein] synthase II [Polyangiaceae bacterium]